MARGNNGCHIESYSIEIRLPKDKSSLGFFSVKYIIIFNREMNYI